MQNRLETLRKWTASMAGYVAILLITGVSNAVHIQQTGNEKLFQEQNVTFHPRMQPTATGALKLSGPSASRSTSIDMEHQYAVDSEASPSFGPSPLRALLQSFVIPGWGHHYVDSGDWRRGQYHLAAEVILVGAYLGINRQSYVLEKNMYTHAGAYSGVDIRDRERQFELAVGNFRSLEEYNDYQERTRNLDRLFPDTPEYRWEWESADHWLEYRDLRSRRDNLNQQLPALAAFMVVNRVFSGISAYNRARTRSSSTTSVHVVPGPDRQGFEARVSISF